jgi:iron-regulated transporter 1
MSDGDVPLLSDDPRPSTVLHPNYVYIYVSHALSAFGDRMWQFAIPILFMEVWDDTLFPSAVFTFATYLAGFFMMPYVGDWVDRSPRLHVVKVCDPEEVPPYLSFFLHCWLIHRPPFSCKMA